MTSATADTRRTDPLSILSLAAGLGALGLVLVSVLPMVGLCTTPLSVICVSLSLISGVASVVRTTINRQLDGRMQALAGLGLSMVWCLGAVVILLFVRRFH